MKKLRPIAVASALASLLAGCSGGGTNGSPPITSVNPLNTGKLEFAVGTANIYGTSTGLNVVSTYRQSSGLSNVSLDSPTITGPFTVPSASTAGALSFDPYSTLPGGPSVEEVSTPGVIGSTSASLAIGTPACDQLTPCTVPNNQTGGTSTIAPNTSTFGQAGGVFVNGFSPGNSTQNAAASSYIPYFEPLYDGSTNSFIPFGGPPAFDPDANGMGVRDGLNNIGDGVVGIPENMTTFEAVTASTGTYKLAVAVPTGNNAGKESYGTVAASASLNSLALLGAITPPTLTLDGNGGASFTIASLPAGVTEEYVQIVDEGAFDDSGDNLANCQGATGPENGAEFAVYYTIIVKAPGTYTLPDTDGPNTNTTGGKTHLVPSPSICTAAQNSAATSAGTTSADVYTVQAIGTDYPLYESTYPINTTQSPTLAGANGQADITISAVDVPADDTAIVRSQRLKRTRFFASRHTTRF